ncbi:MAG: hypothetical protein IPO43_16675 [Rhodoferax sp.]|nr:hypothetical protein [Rhodoferax sp.]
MNSTKPMNAAPSSSRFSGWRGALAISLVVLLAALLLFAAAEGAVRLRQWLRHGAVSSFDSLYVVDPVSGLRVPRANSKLGAVSINSKGFRGPELALPKPPKRLRIAFVGASTTYCAEVSSDAAVWTQGVTDLLQLEFPQVSFDFINAGVPGYSVRSSTKHFDQYVQALQADAVMIYHGTNDMSAELRALAEAKGLWSRNGEVQSWLARQSLLVDLVEKNLRVRAAGATDRRWRAAAGLRSSADWPRLRCRPARADRARGSQAGPCLYRHLLRPLAPRTGRCRAQGRCRVSAGLHALHEPGWLAGRLRTLQRGDARRRRRHPHAADRRRAHHTG